MTRKHYKLLAEAIRKTKKDGIDVDRVARRIADALERDNPKFERLKFIEACGL